LLSQVQVPSMKPTPLPVQAQMSRRMTLVPLRDVLQFLGLHPPIAMLLVAVDVYCVALVLRLTMALVLDLVLDLVPGS